MGSFSFESLIYLVRIPAVCLLGRAVEEEFYFFLFMFFSFGVQEDFRQA
jgi:hypothetical protein